MSILIKGMEMPESCFDCPISHFAYCRTIACGITGKTISASDYEKMRLDNCPLVPIQEHGDLIDRDALLDTATIHWSQTTNESCFPIDEIEYAPIIIPADGKDTDVHTREEGE